MELHRWVVEGLLTLYTWKTGCKTVRNLARDAISKEATQKSPLKPTYCSAKTTCDIIELHRRAAEGILTLGR